MHAPLSDPGGVLRPRPTALRTAAFRPLHTVGFPSLRPWGRSYWPRLYIFRGSITQPTCSFRPASYAHYWVCTWTSLLTCWLGFGQVGFAPHRCAPTG